MTLCLRNINRQKTATLYIIWLPNCLIHLAQEVEHSTLAYPSCNSFSTNLERLHQFHHVKLAVDRCTSVVYCISQEICTRFCFAVLCCGYTLTDFPISIRLTSLALWQSNDCPSASKATLMNMDKYFMWIHYERLHNHNKAQHNKTVCIFLGIYCNYSWWFHFQLVDMQGSHLPWSFMFNSIKVHFFWFFMKLWFNYEENQNVLMTGVLWSLR